MNCLADCDTLALEISFRIAPSHRVEFLQTMSSLLASKENSASPGSQSCFEQVGMANTFLWRECWGSRAEVEDRLRSSAIRTLLGAIGVLGQLDRLEILEPSRQAEMSIEGR